MGSAALMGFPLAAFADDSFTLPTSQATGLGADTGRKVYWVTGEQGGSIDAVSASGKKLGTVSYKAETQSVQALSFYNNNAYVGDIGGSREQIRVIRLSALSYGKTATSTTWKLRYPDGAHEARGFAVSPKGNLYVITGGDKPAIYRPNGSPDANKVVALSKVADAPSGVTDMVFLPDGGSIALRTGDQIQVVDTQNWKLKASAPMPAGSEALSLALSGAGLISVEGAQASTTVVPTTIATTEPTPDPTPEATERPNPPAPSDQTDTTDAKAVDADTTDVSRVGTYTAIGIAAALSLAAAVVVILKK